MKALIAALFASTMATSAAVAQYAPFNETGVTMGHWHLVSHDVAVNKKLFMGMGGRDIAAATVQFPGARINLNLGNEPPGKGGTIGSAVNHVGFIVNNVQARVAEWKAAGVPVDRKSTRLNSSHLVISYAVFCLKKKKKVHRVLVTDVHIV